MQPNWPLQQTGRPRRPRSRNATECGRLLSGYVVRQATGALKSVLASVGVQLSLLTALMAVSCVNYPSASAYRPPAPANASSVQDPTAATRRSKINASTLTWTIGMLSSEVEAQIGLPDYASIKSMGGFPGGPITIGGITVQKEPVKQWTARICRYNCEVTGGPYLREQAYFEVTYHQKPDGSWGLNGWEWRSEIL